MQKDRRSTCGLFAERTLIYMEKLLCIAVPDAKSVEAIAARLRIRTVFISPEQYQTPVGTLAGYTKITPQSDMPNTDTLPQEGILVLCEFKNNRMDRLLQALRQNGMQSVYKAILTPSNASWSIMQLAHALMEERRQMES